VLPRVTGSELLKHMQSDPALRHTRVIVITAMNPEDVRVVADLMPPSARVKVPR
jgi:CheY-like chemotaxis protein